MSATNWEDAYRVQTARIAELERENAELRAHAERVGEANDRLAVENAALREERDLWEAKCHELIAPHYILSPDLRAAKFREALRFHTVLNKKAQATIDAARQEAQP